MKVRHFDPSARCWLSRQVDERTGRIKISPNAYSPAYTLGLLRLILTERRERPRTFSAGMDSAGSEAALQSPYPYLLMT